MNALELIHTENVVVMSTICKMFFKKGTTGEELAEKTTREWANAFKQIRNNW